MCMFVHFLQLDCGGLSAKTLKAIQEDECCSLQKRIHLFTSYCECGMLFRELLFPQENVADDTLQFL